MTVNFYNLGVSVFLNTSIAAVQLIRLYHIRTKPGKHNVMFYKFPECSGKATRLYNQGSWARSRALKVFRMIL